jgi:hypothetical protein
MANASTINIWQLLRRNSPPGLWDKLEGLNPCTPDEMDPPAPLEPVLAPTGAFKCEQDNRKA